MKFAPRSEIRTPRRATTGTRIGKKIAALNIICVHAHRRRRPLDCARHLPTGGFPLREVGRSMWHTHVVHVMCSGTHTRAPTHTHTLALAR